MYDSALHSLAMSFEALQQPERSEAWLQEDPPGGRMG